VLQCEPGQVDLYRFEHLVSEARAAFAERQAARSVELYDRALALWRGDPLGDLADEPFAELEIRRLEEARLGAVEGRIEAALALGRAADVVTEIEHLVARHPYHERLRVQLMTALYRTGRQTEALQVYHDGRKLLVDELGIEPGAELQALQGAILRHDEAIDVEPTPPAAGGGAAKPARPVAAQGRGRPFRRALVVLAIGAATAGLVLALVGTGDGEPAFTGPGLVSLDPRTGNVAQFAHTELPPGAVVREKGSIWVTQPAEGTVLRLDSRTGDVVGSAKIGEEVGGLAAEHGMVWAASRGAGSIARIDTATGKVAEVVPVGNDPGALASGYGSIWVMNEHDRTVSRVDPRRGHLVALVPTGCKGPGLAVGAGGVWVTDEPTGRVVEIDPRSNTVVRTIAVGKGPTALAVDGRSVWVVNRIDGTVSRIEARTATAVETIEVGDSPSAVVVEGAGAWVANELSDTVSKLAPSADTQRVVVVKEGPTGLYAAGSQILVSLTGP
jgi:YVTN family beta-propeller protein